MAHTISLSLSILALVSVTAVAEPAKAERSIVYGRDIRPILSARCFACHGPDRRNQENELRLDTREEAVKDALVPGKAAASALIRRVTSSDPDFVMPPSESNKPALSAGEIELLRRWVDSGAEYSKHWAYEPPARRPVPASGDGWAVNAIDRFVAARHAELGLQPAPDADRRTLARRLSFDLIGLPPAPGEVEAFGDHERAVDRLLSSAHFGERMAMYWLDLVRYADTCGYHGDQHRDIDPYRDWVIDAFNSNKGFDEFTVEQLAGDLLPNATVAQRVASGYNRLLQTTEEGGAQAKEYRAIYGADRVRNVSTVWLGSTMGCAQCHDHKFDPFTMKDFYSLAAFFADIDEPAVGRHNPNLSLPSAEQNAGIARLDRSIRAGEGVLAAANEQELASHVAELGESDVVPEFKTLVAGERAWEAETRAKLTTEPERSTTPGVKLPADVLAAIVVEPAKRGNAQIEAIRSHYRSTAPSLAALRGKIDAWKKERDRVRGSIRKTIATTTTKPRTVRILPRGNWLDDSGEIVLPAVPAFLTTAGGGTSIAPKPRDGAKRLTRLDLARWIVSRDNPLTARVLVNRLWKLFFGAALSRSLEDVGSQGQWPTHPELLDWLAVELMESGWDVKHVVKLIVMSRTYRQSSLFDAERLERDPLNRWLTRQNRFRLDAELVRDNALAIAGLLVLDVGGRSAKPYQPAGYWAQLNFPKREYQHDRGREQYRRGLYTYWCRTFLHPSLKAFDAPTREECTAQRTRSNTPLQALVLLNDPTYVEAARVFAARIVTSGTMVEERVRFAVREALSRVPTDEELEVLGAVARKQSARYRNDERSARELASVGIAPEATDAVDARELAAWTAVARVILNLHETITRY